MLNDILAKMKTSMTIIEQDVQSFQSGKKIAATRARQQALILKKITQQIRDELLTQQKAMPKKVRISSPPSSPIPPPPELVRQ